MTSPTAFGSSPRGATGRGFAIGLLLLPIAEIAVLVLVAQWIGWWTLAVLAVGAVLGIWLVRREGARAWQRVAEASSGGQPPTRELLDGFLILVGGVTLMVPGLITDVIALFLLLPFTRPLARRGLRWYLRRRFGDLGDRFETQTGRVAGTVVEGEVVEGDVVVDPTSETVTKPPKHLGS